MLRHFLKLLCNTASKKDDGLLQVLVSMTQTLGLDQSKCEQPLQMEEIRWLTQDTIRSHALKLELYIHWTNSLDA
jgi:hypothetical protein